MSIDSTSVSSTRNRVVSAFFDTRGAARQAIDDLVAAGIPRDGIAETGGQDAEAGASSHGHKSWWDSLKDFFLPDADRLSYEEGLRRGGHLLTVHTDDAHYQRVLDILDTDGAVDMDEREAGWRKDGWAGTAGAVPGSGLIAGSTLDAGVNAPAIPASQPRIEDDERSTTGADSSWRDDDLARSAALGTAPRAATRDRDSSRTRLRSYILDDETDNTKLSSPEVTASSITEHMEVISADGQSIGLVDHLDGPDRIKLSKNSSPDGQHHVVPFSWIDHVDAHVHLNKTLAEIKAGQESGR